jgi:GNAT superfamily N-acetyltransferase
MTIAVRGATRADAEIICLYNRLLARETEAKELEPALVERGVVAVLDDPGKGRYFLAEENGRVIGQLAVTYEWSDWRAGFFWWLQSVYVAAEGRRRGVFRLLLQHVQELARTDPSAIGIRLYVERDNAVAQATYRKLGLETTPYLVMEQYPL